MSTKGKAAVKIGASLLGIGLAPFTGGASLAIAPAIGQAASSLIPESPMKERNSLAMGPGNPMNSYTPLQTSKDYSINKTMVEDTSGKGLDVAADVFGSLAGIAGNALEMPKPTDTPDNLNNTLNNQLSTASKINNKSPQLTAKLYPSTIKGNFGQRIPRPTIAGGILGQGSLSL